MNLLKNQEPLPFIAVGSGQVFDKYFLRAANEGIITIPAVVSLETETRFRTRYPEFNGAYLSTHNKDTLSVIATAAAEVGSPNIALLTPAQVRFELIKSLYSHPDLNRARTFVEKPYVDNPADIEALRDIAIKHSGQLHLSGKYAFGRANILYPHLPEGVTPDRITANLIEGTSYFQVVQNQLTETGSSQFLMDGPETDLGFHLLNIVSVAAQRFGGVGEIQIEDVYDLREVRGDFRTGYGFGASLIIKTQSDKDIPMDLQAGKADTKHNRTIIFYYGSKAIRQEYTVEDATDPVTLIEEDSQRELARHQAGYNYYAEELRPNVFCKQTPDQQVLNLQINQIILEMRKRRIDS